MNPLAELGPLPGLDATTLEGLSPDQQQSIITDVSKICRKMMVNLGVTWKPQPVDPTLRTSLVDWIKSQVQPSIGKPVNKAFLLSTDGSAIFTEYVYEDHDAHTKLCMAKILTLCLYLDDLAEKDDGMASQAELFLTKMLDGGIPTDTAIPPQYRCWLELFRKHSLDLARCMSDPIATSMLLHSFTVFLEATALENRIQRDRAIYDTATCDVETERHHDQAYEQAANQGREIPLPLDTDWVTNPTATNQPSYLRPDTFPTWLRERTGGTEIFIISSFRCPGGIDIPTAYWLPAIYEMRSFSNDINDLYSFAKEMLAGDTHSFIAMSTRDKRALGVPGTASDGGWCLRDTLAEMCSRVLDTSGRTNRILRPKGRVGCRYGDDGSVLSVDEMVGMLKEEEPIVGAGRKRQDLMSALALRLWETHQRGYVAYHLQSTRYRAFELFDWVREMAGEKGEGPGWILDQFATPSAVTTSLEEADGGKSVQEDTTFSGYGGHHQSRRSLLTRVTHMIKTWMGKQ
ncbi:hypothetical protein QBC37DRAFT_404063 [Rhypophila decipiens]|uniref:Uncharacterized protein n=1 Tax=Rhypophila decipiens TaxID=261697 RepID=A0AAN6XZQ0_9PEZI|nr:hypothetical protein QBC37DRAFT_404063 [Rhypophila decipiens]